ncbi:MAG: hypothetical protein NT099_03480 [Candidatus Saganbacteria bacterium]|nr:hypothetical protein [Candidatus Saganbacteria bacterium]
MNTAVLQPNLGMSLQSRVAQTLHMDWFGYNRTSLLQRIKALGLNLEQQQKLIRIFASNGLIKAKALDRVSSLDDLLEGDLSIKITSERLEHSISQFNGLDSLGGTNLQVLTVAPILSSGIAGDDISNILWGIRDSLHSVAEVFASQNQFMGRIFGSARASQLNRARNLQIIRLLYIASTNFAGLEEVQRLDENWHTEVDGMPEAARAIWQNFLSVEGNFTASVTDAMAELARLTSEQDFMQLSPREANLQSRLATVMRELAEDHELGVDRNLERAQCLKDTIQAFIELRENRSMEMLDMRRTAEKLLEVVDLSIGVLNTAEGTNDRTVATGKLMAATKSAVWAIKDLVEVPPVKHRLLQAAAILGIAVTSLYLVFRITTTFFGGTHLLRAGLTAIGIDVANDPFFKEWDDAVVSGMLLSAEVFFDWLALVFMGNLIQALRKTKGGDGAAHVPRLRQHLNKDFEKRERAAHMMVLVNEPVIAIEASISSDVRSALWHGNADVLVADNSMYSLNRVGGAATIRAGRKMVGRHRILRQAINQIIYPRLKAQEGESSAKLDAKVKAHKLAIHMASEYTEADDAECQRFAFERPKEILRSFHVEDKHVEVIGREIGRMMMEENNNITKDSRELLRSPFTTESLTKLFTSHGVPLDKAMVMAEMFRKEIDTLIRRSNIAKICDRIFKPKGENLSPETRQVLREALIAEGRITVEEAEQIIDYITTFRESMNEAVAFVGSESVVVPAGNATAMRGFSLVYEVAEELMRQDKRINSIDEGVEDRVSQVVQKVVLMKHRPVKGKIPILSGIELRRCQDAALEIARRMSLGSPKLSKLREGIMQAERDQGREISFLEADTRAWENREIDIKEIVEEVFGQGNPYGVSRDEAKEVAEEIIGAMRNNHQVRLTTAVEFAQQLIPLVRTGQTPEQIVAAVFSGQAGPLNANKEKRVMIEILVNDMPQLRLNKGGAGISPSPLDHPARAAWVAILEKFDPTDPAQFEKLATVLERQLGASAEFAQGVANAYRERYQAIIVKLTEAVRELKACSGDLTPIQVTARAGVTTYADSQGHQWVSMGGVSFDLTEIKADSEQRVRKPNYSYPGWGAKGSTIGCLLVGDCIPQNIGVTARWITHQFVNERFFQNQAPVTNREVGDLDAERIAQLNTLVSRTRQVKVPPEMIARIDRQITGNHLYLVPPTADARFTHPDFVASYLLSRLTFSGCFGERNFSQADPARAEADIANMAVGELMDLWGFSGMSEADRTRFGVTAKTEETVRERALYLCGETQMRLATASVLNFIGNRPGCTREAAENAARQLGERAELTEAQIKVVAEKAGEIIDLRDRGVITVQGTGDNCFIQTTARAAREGKIEEVLLRHYQRTLSQYEALTEGHGSSVGNEEARTRELKETDEDSDLTALNKLVFDPEQAASVASATATVTNEQQFLAKALELHCGGKERAEAIKELMEAMGINVLEFTDSERAAFAAKGKAVPTVEQRRAEIEQATEKAMDEALRRFGVFFEPLMETLLIGFESNPTQDFSPLIASALSRATFLTDAEKTAFGSQAVGFVKMLQDIFVMEERVHAVRTSLADGPRGRSRLQVAIEEDALPVSERFPALAQVEQLQAFMIPAATANAAQIAENIVIGNKIPLVTTNRDVFGLEVRAVGSLVDEEYSQIEGALKTKAAELDANPELTREQKVNQLHAFMVLEMEKRLQQRAALPCEQNYFAANGKDRDGGEVPMDVDCSTLKYAAIFVNDADYREPLETFTEAVANTVAHPGYVHFGFRQFGRNYRTNEMARTFQSGGNAYWSWTNEANSLKGLTPSWGAQMCYSTRAYRDGSRFIQDDFHVGLVKDKFSLAAKWAKAQRWFILKMQNRSRVTGAVLSVAAQTVNIPVTLTASLLDFAVILPGHVARDVMHRRAEKGKTSLVGERPLDEDKIINRKINELLAVQDATTESEDIATDIYFARLARFMMDETIPKSRNPFHWMAMQFASEGTYHVPQEMFSSAWLPGIGGLGSHSEDYRGDAVTALGRWSRGNFALIPSIMDTKYGFWRKMNFMAMAGFWGKGVFKPFLQTSLLSYMYFGLQPMVLSQAPTMLGLTFTLSFLTFGLNLGVFLAAMHVKGYLNRDDLKEGLACLHADNIGAGRQWRSVIEGLRGDKPAFGQSPKEAEAPEKVWIGEFAADYAFTGLNAGAIGTIAYKAIESSAAGANVNLWALPLLFWAGWNTYFGLKALWLLNKGAKLRKAQVDAKETDLIGYLAKTGNRVLKGMPAYKGHFDPMVIHLAYASEEGDMVPTVV